LRAYGAGILSSPGELPHSVNSTAPQRIGLDLMRCMRTRYKIDTFQQTYFVINGLPDLVKLTEPDFTPLYEAVRNLPELAADERLAHDVPFTP
jgi:phenylalanine-4-hydroxylase